MLILAIFYCEMIFAEEPTPPASCDAVPRHIGFDAFGADLHMDLKKNEKTLEEVTLLINKGVEPFGAGIPLPCIAMLEASSEGSNDILDLKLNKCTNVPTKWFKRAGRDVKEFFTKDPNNKSDFKFYSYNPKDSDSYLKEENLKSFFGSGGALIQNQDTENLNAILSKNADCKLRDTFADKKILDLLSLKDKSYARYIYCPNVTKEQSIENHLESTLKDNCAVSYKSGADIFNYSTSDKKTKEQNINDIKECVKKFSNLPDDLKEKEITLKVDVSPKIKNKNDEFKMYDKECNKKNASAVVNDLNIVLVMSDISKYYSDDISTCLNCQGVKIISDNQIGFFKDLGEDLFDVCKGEIGAYKSKIKDKCLDKKLSCSSFENVKCALEIELDSSSNKLNLNDFSALKDGYNEEVNKKYILPIHQALNLMTDTSGNQNRSMAKEEITKLIARLDKLRSCVSDKKQIEYLYITNPQPSGRYLAENLLELGKLVDKLKNIKDPISPEKLKEAAKKDLLSAFNTYGEKTKKLYDLSEDDYKKKESESDSCGALSSVLSQENKCEVSEQGLKKSSNAIDKALEDYDEDKSDILEKYKTKISEKLDDSTTVQKMDRYLKLLGGDFSTKSKKDEMVELLILNEELKGKTKGLEMQCDEETSLDSDKIASVFGKNGKKLSEKDVSSKANAKAGDSGIAADEEVSLRQEIENLKADNATIMQNLNAALAQLQNGGASTAGMTNYADAMLSGFTTYANTLASINQNTTSTLMSGFNQFSSALQAQSSVYAQSLGQQSMAFNQAMYSSNNSSMNAMNYSQTLYANQGQYNI